MRLIEKLELQIRTLSAYVEENESIDQTTKNTLNSEIDKLYELTYDMQQQREKTWQSLNTIMDNL